MAMTIEQQAQAIKRLKAALRKQEGAEAEKTADEILALATLETVEGHRLRTLGLSTVPVGGSE